MEEEQDRDAELASMLKQLARDLAHRSGAMQLVQRLNRDRLRILMYHRFPPKHSENFDRQCALLAKDYKVVSLAEAVRRVQAHEPLDNLAVITVDDGYADMHEVAFPTLKKYRLPATLFVTTGFINRTCWMPGDRVRQAFAHAQQPSLQVKDEHGKVHTFSTRGGDGAAKLRELLKRVPNQTRARILTELDGMQEGKDTVSIPTEYQPCTWDQLREMAANGVSIGGHTITHPILSRLETATDKQREILDSKTTIENELQQEAETFAYPNGTLDDMDPVSVACVRTSFRGAVTAIHGLNPAGTDVYQLLRLPCDPDLPVSYMARMMAGPLRRSR